MNCANHPEVSAAAFCRACGKALCPSCQRAAQGTVFCAEHVPVEEAASAGGTSYQSPYTVPPTAPPPPAWTPHANVSPGLAFILGFIPGVGAIYNGQYAKGLIHVLVLGTLISIMSSGNLGPGEVLFGFMVSAWFFYMAFEAYHTARRRQFGQPVDEFSSVFPLRGKAGRFPVGPVVLIAIGVLFLLNNFNLIHFYDIARFWPVFLIALGAYMLYTRLTNPLPPVPEEAVNEQR